MLTPPRTEKNCFLLASPWALWEAKVCFLQSHLWQQQSQSLWCQDFSSKLSTPAGRNDEEVVEVRRTSRNGLRAFPFLCVTEPGTAPPQRQQRSTPFLLCITWIPMEAALLVSCSLTSLQVIYGLSHSVTHWHFSPAVLWGHAAPHPPTNSLNVLEQRRDVPQVEFEDLSYRRCDTSSPRIWKGKVWLSFAVLFPLVNPVNVVQVPAWRMEEHCWILLCNCTWQWERKITAHPWLWRLLGRYPN